ncbi:MAG: peptidoglycan DD-metalloendopeptidase family protein [Bacteroidetes bacterium]|nr:peptidoglycan DD-metalloendopeptidase family protein [Bacteroidota bacterium]
MSKKWLLALIFIPIMSFAQRNVDAIVDTVEMKNGTVLLFKNFTWEYLENEPVMMSIEEDSTGIFSSQWINDQIFAYKMQRDSIKDTLLVLVDTVHPFHMPVYGHLFRGFTYTHKGLDIKLNKGDTVRAAFNGVVRYAKYNRGGFGNLVIIRHYNGLESYYAHNSKLLVRVNQVVKAGDPISLGGSSGRSRGPHCHFELRYKDVPMDALRVIDFDNQKLITRSFPITKKVFYPNDYNNNAVYHKIKNGDTLVSMIGK